MDRTERALHALDLSGRGLEFGPSHAPLVTKASGARVETLDHATRAELVEKYRQHGMAQEHLDAIEEVDHVWSGGSVLDLIPEHGVYDYLIASHFIEHSVDLIGFLHDAEVLLAPGGRLALVIPDKRYCFDRMRPISTLGDAIDAKHSPLAFHTPGAVIDEAVYAIRRGDVIAWAGGAAGELSLVRPDLSEAADAERNAVEQREYVDTHHWIFTPTSFELLIHDLAQLGHHGLGIVELSTAGGHEFFVTLGRDVPPRDIDRMALLRRIEVELADVGPGGPLDSAHPEVVHEEIARLRDEVAALRSSTSWRVTRPMRAMAGLFSRRRAR